VESDELGLGTSVLEPGAQDFSRRLARWVLWPLLTLFVVIVVVFYLIFTPVYVDGESMLPTLESGDRALRTQSYTQPVRDDVVVVNITLPSGQTEDLVKRVIALPGDTIEVRDDVAYVNGAKEDTGHLTLQPGYGENRAAAIVQPGQLYVMGDNRYVSMDSRYVGTLPIRRVRGKVVAVFAPIDRASAVH